MQVQPRHIGLYVDPQGLSPFMEWTLGLKDEAGQAAVFNRLDRMTQGNLGDFKRLGSLYELRLHTGPGYRVYFGQDGPLLVVLLVGGNKSTQAKDIKTAERYWNDYQKRKTQALTSL